VVWKAVLRGLERSLPAHPDSRFQPVPTSLSRRISGSLLNQRDHVQCWYEGRRRASFGEILNPGIVTVKDAGLVGHTVVTPDGKIKAIVNIVDRSGWPLFFPFKKEKDWSLRNFLRSLALGFVRRTEAQPQRYALLGSASVSFYHFVTEVAGDWWLLKQMGYVDGDFSAVVVHGQGKDWQEEILDMLGIAREKRRYHDAVRERHVELVVPYRTKASAESVPTWICDALWSELGGRVPTKAGTRKIFVSRKDALRRRMVNEADLTGRLEKAGFEVVQLEGRTFAEQQDLFASSRWVVAEHGAALTNLVWCPPNAVVIDIHRDAVAAVCFKALAELRGLRYLPIFGAAGEKLGHGDWRIGEEAIARVCSAIADTLEPCQRPAAL